MLQVGKMIGRYLALLSALGAVHGRCVADGGYEHSVMSPYNFAHGSSCCARGYSHGVRCICWPQWPGWTVPALHVSCALMQFAFVIFWICPCVLCRSHFLWGCGSMVFHGNRITRIFQDFHGCPWISMLTVSLEGGSASVPYMSFDLLDLAGMATLRA